MGERIPAIRVTDPQSQEMYPQSPPGTQSLFGSSSAENGTSRSDTTNESRPNTSSGIPSPAKLLRSLSNSNSNTKPAPRESVSPISVATGAAPPASAEAPHSPIDPLSQHILRRTNTLQNGLPTLLRPSSPGASATSDDKSTDDRADGSNVSPRQPPRVDTASSTTPKEKRKGVSFLSRIIGGTKKKDSADDASDGVSETHSDVRPEGMEAEVFSQPVNNIGYEPRHAQPPAYIRVRAHHKKEKDFDRVFLAQELLAPKKHDKCDDAKSIRSVRSTRPRPGTSTNADTVWAMQWSRDGKYLAVAGHEKVIRVWAVLTSPEERRKEGMEDDDDGDSDFPQERHTRLSAPVFQSKPIREFEGHTATVLDLTWSKNNFLLSSSMDKTVRLWHVSRQECLCTFKHNDFVTSIAFHPKDDRFFLAGSLDSKLRLWSIPDKTVAYWNNLGDMITAVEFTPDGKYAIGGCLNGLCMFYETEGLKYQTQIHVRSSHGKNAKGSKITNIQAIYYPPNTNDTKLLITSNDSRVRLYNFRDKALEIKFKGNVNDNSQIRASFSDDARYIICGSEDNKAYIWTMSVEEGEKRDKRPVEFFTASDSITTCAAFAPSKTRQVLGRSGDPMYDICNPPPVTLMSKAEHAESRPSSIAPTEDDDSPRHSESNKRRPGESAGYIARSAHPNGHIIVTADFNGRLRVFRQDCAWAKRRNDHWETSSVFSKAAGRRRTASIATRGSSRSLRSAQGSVKTQAPSERILSWRQAINSTSSVNGASSTKSGKTGRSISPRKSSSQLSYQSNKVQGGRPQTAAGVMAPPPRPKDSGITSSTPPTPPTPAKKSNIPPAKQSDPNVLGNHEKPDDHNPLGLQGDNSTLFWKLAKTSAMVHRTHHFDSPERSPQISGNASPRAPGLEPPHVLQRNVSAVSTLSIERSEAGTSSDDEFLDAVDAHDHQHGADHPPNHGTDHQHGGHYDHGAYHQSLNAHKGSTSEVVCRHCHSTSFKAARSKSNNGETKLVCTACGTPAWE